MIDDACPKAESPVGTQNNVISIDEADFAVNGCASYSRFRKLISSGF
jgi:hypothetical protein